MSVKNWSGFLWKFCVIRIYYFCFVDLILVWKRKWWGIGENCIFIYLLMCGVCLILFVFIFYFECCFVCWVFILCCCFFIVWVCGEVNWFVWILVMWIFRVVWLWFVRLSFIRLGYCCFLIVCWMSFDYIFKCVVVLVDFLICVLVCFGMNSVVIVIWRRLLFGFLLMLFVVSGWSCLEGE